MFNSLKVIELASVLAGPSVGQFFAELGANVIKVENVKTGGDVTRSWKVKGEDTDDRSAYFCSVNWGKRSLALDLESVEAINIIHRLVSSADIVIVSYKPGDAKKLKVDYETLFAINPAVIYGEVTGYGSHNKRVGYDAIIQAEAGFMFMNGEPEGPSLKIPVALMDILAAHHLKEGLLLALLHKEKAGKGAKVEVSLIETAISSLVNQATNWLVAGKLPLKQGSAHPNIAPYGETFFTRDGKEVLLAVGNDRQFQDLCVLLQLGDLASNADYINNSARVMNRHSLFQQLKSRIMERDAGAFIRECNSKNIPAGLIQNMEEVFQMDEAKAIMIHSSNLKGLRTFPAHADFIQRGGAMLPPPHFGEHTVSIVEELKRS